MRLWLKIKILAAYRRQKEFAKTIGMRPDLLSRIINGRVNPSEVEKKLIADALSVEDIESLFIEQKTQLN